MPISQRDYLAEATNNMAPTQEEARARLTQEALTPITLTPPSQMRAPSELRKLFPSALKNANLDDDPEHLNMREIERGINNPQISRQDREVLTVLKQGFAHYNLDATGGSSGGITDEHFNHDPKGVSAESLAMLDKAMNRELDEDPYLKNRTIIKVAGNAIAFGAVAAGKAAFHGDREGKSLAIIGLLGAATGATIGGAQVALEYYTGKNDRLYDNAANTYRNFLKSKNLADGTLK